MRSLITLALAALVFATAGAQTRKNCCEKAAEAESAFYNPTATRLLRSVPAQVTERSITAQADSLLVSFEAQIPADYLANREAYVLTPIMTAGQHTTTLPALSVEGRDYNRVKMFQKDNDLHVAYLGEAMTVKYRYVTPATNQRSNGSLRVDGKRQSLCDCDKDKAPKQKRAKKAKGAEADGIPLIPLIAPEVTPEPEKPAAPDLSAFKGKTQKLYYIPTGYTIKESYVNDFGAKSLFKVGGTWTKMSVFRPAMEDILVQYDSLKKLPEVKINEIKVTVSSSPEGPYSYNDLLAQLRGNQISALINKNFKQLDPSLIEVVPQSENWDGFSKALATSNIEGKDEIAKIVSESPDFDQRESLLRKRADWPQVLNLFQEVRNCDIAIEYETAAQHPHNCTVNEQGLIESSLKKNAGYITTEQAEQIAHADNAPAHLNNLLAAYIEQGSYKKAEECATRIGDKDVTPAIANNLGVLYSLIGDKGTAEKYFGKATSLPAANYNRGVMLLNDGDKDAAEKLLHPYTK